MKNCCLALCLDVSYNHKRSLINTICVLQFFFLYLQFTMHRFILIVFPKRNENLYTLTNKNNIVLSRNAFTFSDKKSIILCQIAFVGTYIYLYTENCTRRCDFFTPSTECNIQLFVRIYLNFLINEKVMNTRENLVHFFQLTVWTTREL